MRTITSFLHTIHRSRVALLCAILFAAIAAGVPAAHAAWNGQPYEPEQTLDPECAPSSPNCRIVRPVITGEGIPAGSLAYTSGTDEWMALPAGSDGQVLKVQGGMLVWAPDAGGVTYNASEQGLHLATSTNVFSIALDGSSLTQSANGLRVAPGYTGQSSISTLGTITSGAWEGTTLAPSYGGTGATTTPGNGQLLIGNGSTYTVANATGSGGITIASGAGSLNIGLSVNGLNAVSSAATDDYVLLYQGSSGNNRKISVNDLFSGVLGSLHFQGTWNANTNSPSLSNGACISGMSGSFYIVGTAGSTALGGISSWNPGDWALCDGTTWTKIASANAVASVFGRAGTVTAQSGDYTAAQVTNVATGTISATTLQGAINELAGEKEATIAPGLTTQYWRGDKSWQTLDTLAVAENPVHLYYTDARSRSAISSASASISYATSTGVISIAGGYSIPQSGAATGDTLAWDGSAWVPTGGLMTFDTGDSLVSIDGTASTTQLRVSSSAFIASSTIGTLNAGTLSLSSALGVGSGGTGLTAAPTLGQVLMGNSSGGYTLAATSSLGLNLNTLSGTLGISSGGTGATSLGVGWLYSPGSGLALSASTTPTVGAIIATSTSLVSTFAGKVGIGSTTPLATLSVKGSGTGSGIALQTTGSTNLPGLTVLDSGLIGIGTSSPIAQLSIAASTTVPSLLVASTTGTLLSVAANGFVGIGTGAPSYPLDVKGDVSGTVARFQTAGGSLLCALSAFTGLLGCTSDERLKKDITAIDGDTLSKVLALNPVSYHWKTDGNDAGLKYGFIAQQVQELFPELVTKDPQTGYFTLSVNGLMPFVVKSLQEQQAAIDALAAHAAGSGVDIDSLARSGGLALSGHVAFGGDTVGEATIAAGEREAQVEFAQLYGAKPVVTVTPEGKTNSAYWVADADENGFVIRFARAQEDDVTFSWHAFASTLPVPPEPSAPPAPPTDAGNDAGATSTDPAPPASSDDASTTEDAPPADPAPASDAADAAETPSSDSLPE